jgi:hypothetical protein
MIGLIDQRREKTMIKSKTDTKKVDAFGGDPATPGIVHDLAKKLDHDVERAIVQAIELATDDVEPHARINIALSMAITAAMAAVRCFEATAAAGIMIESGKKVGIPGDVALLMIRRAITDGDGTSLNEIAIKAVRDDRRLK